MSRDENEKSNDSYYQQIEFVNKLLDIHDKFLQNKYQFEETSFKDETCTKYTKKSEHDGVFIVSESGKCYIANAILAYENGLNFPIKLPELKNIDEYLLEIKSIGSYPFYKAYCYMLDNNLEYIEFESYVNKSVYE